MRKPARAGLADEAGDGLDRDVGDAEQDARGGAQHDAVVLGRTADVLAHDEQGADPDEAALEGDHAGEREVRVRAGLVRQRHPGEEPERGEADAQPLARADLEAEQPLGHDGEEHDAAGEDHLDDGDRRERHRGHVEDPRAGRQRPCRWRTIST